MKSSLEKSRSCEVMKDYNALKTDEIDVEEGEVLTIFKEMEDVECDRIFVRKKDDVEGYIPKDCVRLNFKENNYEVELDFQKTIEVKLVKGEKKENSDQNSPLADSPLLSFRRIGGNDYILCSSGAKSVSVIDTSTKKLFDKKYSRSNVFLSHPHGKHFLMGYYDRIKVFPVGGIMSLKKFGWEAVQFTGHLVLEFPVRPPGADIKYSLKYLKDMFFISETELVCFSQTHMLGVVFPPIKKLSQSLFDQYGKVYSLLTFDTGKLFCVHRLTTLPNEFIVCFESGYERISIISLGTNFYRGTKIKGLCNTDLLKQVSVSRPIEVNSISSFTPTSYGKERIIGSLKDCICIWSLDGIILERVKCEVGIISLIRRFDNSLFLIGLTEGKICSYVVDQKEEYQEEIKTIKKIHREEVRDICILKEQNMVVTSGDGNVKFFKIKKV